MVAIRYHLHSGRDPLEEEGKYLGKPPHCRQEQCELCEGLHCAAREPDHDE